MASPQHPHPLSADALRGGLFDDEYLWRDHQEWLQACGFELRPRYRSGWEPSWLKSKENPNNCEDGQSPLRTIVMDAIRMSDKRLVSIKRLKKADHPQEEEIICYFSTDPHAKDPSNHSVPVYEVLQSPHVENIQFLVMPYLIRLHDVKFATVGEMVECIRQLFEGLRFMHSHHVAHCDVHIMNVMMDPAPLFSERPHPIDLSRSYDFKRKVKQYTRTGHPTSYYYIDFGLSYKFSSEKDNLVRVAFGGDKSVPEYKDAATPKDPYKIDVYCLGNLIKKDMIEQVSGLDFLKPLVIGMIDLDPAKRPSMDVACERLEELFTSLSRRKLRSRAVYRSENPIARLCRDYRHMFRTLFWIATGTPVIPSLHGSPLHMAVPSPCLSPPSRL